MKLTGVTVGRSVSDLDRSTRWYERVLELGDPDLRPVETVVEYDLGGTWLQLGQGDPAPGNTVVRFGVPDVRAERTRLINLGIAVDELVDVPGVVAYFEFDDPDGYRLSCYTEA
ncbi:VOC family protein [Microlunatus sp. GCM10028923]|uniref:VOC family protein n=1 Tax=Microlunatus sp. GCM10028923 TaxID=3273400 RepID=UPI00361D9BF6